MHRILKRVDEFHFGQAEDHPSRGLGVFFLVTSFTCVYFGREEGMAVMMVMLYEEGGVLI